MERRRFRHAERITPDKSPDKLYSPGSGRVVSNEPQRDGDLYAIGRFILRGRSYALGPLIVAIKVLLAK
jgi:hypothetical protein